MLNLNKFTWRNWKERKGRFEVTENCLKSFNNKTETMKYLIIINVFLLSHSKTFAQAPINYISGESSVSKDFILVGKSQIKISKTSKVKSLIKSNLEFVDFYTKHKDSINMTYVSSLILFTVNDKKVITPNTIQSDFKLDNIANNCITSFSNQIKFNNLTNGELVLGFYLTFNPNEDIFTFGFVEIKNNQYYGIYEGAKSLHQKPKRIPHSHIIKED